MHLHHLHTAAFGDHHSEKVLTVNDLVNGILRAFFFAIVGKEVWEAVILKTAACAERRPPRC